MNDLAAEVREFCQVLAEFVELVTDVVELARVMQR
jgi:hypothetical protein